MKWNQILVVAVLLYIWGDVNGQIISPYQVSLRLYDNYLPGAGDGNTHLCTGAVIHESFVLTTADCMHVRIRSANVSRPHLPLMLYVAAGSFIGDAMNTRYVDSIFIHEGYNPTTLENDIALVKITEPFPLRNNTAIQWIQLDVKNTRLENCFVSFENRTKIQYPFTSPQPTYVLDNWFCRNSSNSTYYRNNDICSHYILSDTSMCKFSELQFQLSSDRGTPLVCNNHLTGLLSEIIPPQNVSNVTSSCESTLKTWAVYTAVSNYKDWIYQTIARQQPTQPPGQAVTQQPSVTPPPFYFPPQINPQNPSPTTSAPGHKPTHSGVAGLNVSLTFITTVIMVYLVLLP